MTDSSATIEEIRDALSINLVEKLRKQGSGTTLADLKKNATTLFFYFAGYGATNSETGERCILPYDTDLTRLKETCVTTEEIDKRLDDGPWKNAVLIIDASYGGKAGLLSDAKDEPGYVRSRSATESYSQDTAWRATAGLANDRVLLVGSGTNESATESAALQHGVLTASLQQSFNNYASLGSGGDFVPLADVFRNARDVTSKVTGSQQNPILKGSLSEPFMFRNVAMPDFYAEWVPVFTGLRRDILSLKGPDTTQLDKLDRSIAKAIEVYPDHPSPVIAKASAIRYRAAACEGEQCSTFWEDSYSRLEAVSDTVERRFAESRSDEDKELLSYVLLAQAKVLKDMGRVDKGISVCERALQLLSVSIPAQLTLAEFAKLTLAELLMEKSDYDQLSPLLDGILDEAVRKKSSGAVNLAPEELGELVVWQYLALMKAGKREQAKFLLEVYGCRDARITRMKEWLYGIKPARVYFPKMYMRRRQGEVNDDSVLWVFLSNYMLGKHSDSEIQKFEKEAVDHGQMDHLAAHCVINFYVGMRLLFRHEPEKALPFFHLVLETKQFEYPEWWAAQSELNQHTQKPLGPLNHSQLYGTALAAKQ